jgi:hypothetical protein
MIKNHNALIIHRCPSPDRPLRGLGQYQIEERVLGFVRRFSLRTSEDDPFYYLDLERWADASWTECLKETYLVEGIVLNDNANLIIYVVQGP